MNGVWVYDENDERIVLARLCVGCSSDEAVRAIEDKEWREGGPDYEVQYPCAAVLGLSEQPSPAGDHPAGIARTTAGAAGTATDLYEEN